MSKISTILNKNVHVGGFTMPSSKTITRNSSENYKQQKINQEIDRPSHYGSKSGKDVIEWCEDFGIMDNAYIFNIFKYLCRAGKKNNNSELQDALKARIYLERYIEKLQNV